MADMTGWKELASSVIDIYSNLNPEAECIIYCGHYGQAGAIMFYGKKHGIPDPGSSTASFVFWAPEIMTKEYMIFVHTDLNNDFKPDEELPKMFNKVSLISTITVPYFRENGTKIYTNKYPTPYAKDAYSTMMKNLKVRYC